jgi:surfeit locus 1 family protein
MFCSKLINSLNELKDLEYRKVRVKGKFDNSQEVFISPRSLLKSKENESKSSLFSTQSNDTLGAWVITPFNVRDRDFRILVNRGWIHWSKMDPKSRPNGQTDEEVELIGVVRETEKVYIFFTFV